MPTAIILPELGAGKEPLCISGWLVDVGEELLEGDRVVEVVTGGITFDVPAPMSGRLLRVSKPIDAEVRPGDVLGWIEEAVEEPDEHGDPLV